MWTSWIRGGGRTLLPTTVLHTFLGHTLLLRGFIRDFEEKLFFRILLLLQETTIKMATVAFAVQRLLSARLLSKHNAVTRLVLQPPQEVGNGITTYYRKGN